MKKFILGLLLASSFAFAQYPVTANRITTGAGAPSAGCSAVADRGKVYIRKDAAAASSSLYACVNTTGTTTAWELQSGGGGGGASPAGSAVTNAQCWASATTLGVCTSPAFTSPTVTTQSANDNSTKAASTAYVDTARAAYLPLAGGTLTGALLGKTNLLQGSNFCVDAGSTDTYACNLSPAITVYVTGTEYRFMANTTNSGAASINFNGLGALTLVKTYGISNAASSAAVPLDTGDIVVGQWVTCVYDGTNCQITSHTGVFGSSNGVSSSSVITAGWGRNTGTGGVQILLSTGGSGALYSAIMNSTGSDWGNGLARAGYLMAQGALQLGAGNSNIGMTIQTTNEVDIGTNAALGGSTLLGIAGGHSSYGQIGRGAAFAAPTGCGTSTVSSAAATLGEVVIGGNGPCTLVVTMGNSFAASGVGTSGHFNCFATNITTVPGSVIGNTADSTTTASFPIPTGWLTSDHIKINCSSGGY